MPINTRYYGLTAFQWGDVYSARLDKRRFTIIDNELAFISDFIESGVIFGWNIVDNSDGSINVTPGMGLIGRNVYETFGNIKYTLSSNSDHYFYMNASRGQISATSGVSNIASIIAVDTTPPMIPSGITQITDMQSYLNSLTSGVDEITIFLRNLLKRIDEDDLVLTTYKEIAFYWNENTEADFDHYIVKIIEGSEETILGETDNNVYAIGNLQQNSEYVFKIISVDKSDNQSEALEFSLKTDIDTRVPLPPVFVQAFSGNQSIEVIWFISPTDNIDYYKVVLQPLDDDYNNYGSSSFVEIDANLDNEIDSTYAIFEGLEENRYYDITVYSVPFSGESYISEGITTRNLLIDSDNAGEINNIDISFDISNFDNTGLRTNILWSYNQDNPYTESYPYKFIIKFLENGKRYSENIEVLESNCVSNDCSWEYNGKCYELTINYIPFLIDGDLKYESLKEYTSYVITIQTIDIDGKESNGYVFRVPKTPVINTVGAITDFAYNKKNNNDIILTWNNPDEDYFSYNKITVKIVNLLSLNEDVFYVQDLKIGNAENFIIPKDKFNLDYRYDVTIYPYDVFNNLGEFYSTSIQITEASNFPLPSIPADLTGNYKDGCVSLFWNAPSETEEIAYIRIYRAVYDFYIVASGFVLIDTVPASMNSYNDYSVDVGESYMYAVASENIYGTISSNPIDNLVMPSTCILVQTYSSSELSSPENLAVVAGSDDPNSQLSWDQSNEDFDGYEILFSGENKYSFSVIDYVPATQNYYTHIDALLKNNSSYYYIIRKYRNGSELKVTSSSTIPENTVYIGKVTTSSGISNVTIDFSNVIYLENYVIPITMMTEEKLDIHHHDFTTGIDKRIDLSENIVVTDWTTTDYKTYTSEVDISGATAYYLKVTGTINESYFGETNTVGLKQAQANQSPILYEVDPVNNEIIFNSFLYSDSSSVSVPYSDAPILSLTLIGVNEVENLLPEEKIDQIYANQFTSGVLDYPLIPNINHKGRVNETLLPVKLPMVTNDGYLYELESTYDDNDRNVLGTAITFYDVKKIKDDILLAATSNGIYISFSFGSNWEYAASFSTPVHKIHKAADDTVYAITIDNVYKYLGNSYREWKQMFGLDGVRSIRDIAEDEEGNLYISTNVGVYKLNNAFVPFIEDSWQKLYIFGPRSSEAYAIFFDANYVSGSDVLSGRILVSNELGLLQSLDHGLSWVYISELPDAVKIRNFFKTNNCLFAIADNDIYRKNENDNVFINISSLSGIISKYIIVFNDNLYISTDIGPQVSVTEDIYTDEQITFSGTWSETERKNNKSIITSLNIIDSNLFIGTDRCVYLMSGSNKIWMQYEQKNAVIPIFYNDDEEVKLGFYYNNSTTSNNLYFEEFVTDDINVTVANKYDIYYTENKGWADTKCNSEFNIYNNGLLFAQSPISMAVDLSPFVNFVFPDYDDTNSHKETADIYQATLQTSLNNLIDSGGTTTNVADLVSDVFKNIYLFLSQLYKEQYADFVYPYINFSLVKKIEAVSNFGEETESEISIYKEINDERNTNYSAIVNVTTGIFKFDLPFDKYDVLSLDILDNSLKNAGEYSHREVEDKFEYIYSGPTSYLSQVQQVNILKFGIYNERNWPGEQEQISSLLQMKTYIPSDEVYDKLNSTINYEVKYESEEPYAYLSCAACGIFVSDSNVVLIGGKEGLFSIDVSTLEINKFELEDLRSKMIRDIYFDENNDKIYVVSDYNVYLSEDFGSTFSLYNRNGLPSQLYSFGMINNNLIIGANDGIYIKYSSSDDLDWDKVKDSTTPVKIINSSNILLSYIDNLLYLSKNGWVYSSLGKLGIDDKYEINKVIKYNNLITYVALRDILYLDNGSFNGDSPELIEVNLESVLTDGVTINDIAIGNSNEIIIGLSDGKYIIVKEDYLQVKDSYLLNSIHKIILVNNDIWLFGQDLLKVPNIEYPIKISAGLPV